MRDILNQPKEILEFAGLGLGICIIFLVVYGAWAVWQIHKITRRCTK